MLVYDMAFNEKMFEEYAVYGASVFGGMEWKLKVKEPLSTSAD